MVRTVAQLIVDLQRLDPDTPVMVHGKNGMYRTIDASEHPADHKFTFGLSASADPNFPHLLMHDVPADADVQMVPCYVL